MQRSVFVRLTGLSLASLAVKKAAAAVRAVTAPRKRWAMVIDQQKCARAGGCTKCVEACHRVHNVPNIKVAHREVKWIWKEPFARTFPEQATAYTPAAVREAPVLVFCNHCDNPPCVRVCPTQATWKREDGVVTMDWHRCIGCRYCVAACPYGSRSFNWSDPRPHIQQVTTEFPARTKGVVEKCTGCEELLAKGRPPACVAACPEKALVFGNLSDPDSEVRRLIASRQSIRRKPELGTQPSIFYLL